jgi:hypothetical protein
MYKLNITEKQSSTHNQSDLMSFFPTSIFWIWFTLLSLMGCWSSTLSCLIFSLSIICSFKNIILFKRTFLSYRFWKRTFCLLAFWFLVSSFSFVFSSKYRKKPNRLTVVLLATQHIYHYPNYLNHSGLTGYLATIWFFLVFFRVRLLKILNRLIFLWQMIFNVLLVKIKSKHK